MQFFPHLFFFKMSTTIQLFSAFLLLSPHNQFPLPAALCSLTLISPQSMLLFAPNTSSPRLFGGYMAMGAAARRCPINTFLQKSN